MKRKILVILMLVSFTTAHAEDRDYMLHMTTAFMLNTALIMTFKNESEPLWLTTLKASAVVSLLGVSKELFVDAQPDNKDILYNQIGIAASAALFLTFPF